MKNSYRKSQSAKHQSQQGGSSNVSAQSHIRSAIYLASPIEDVRAARTKPLNARKYVGQSHRPSWLQTALLECKGLKELPENWDSYGAQTPNDKALYWVDEALITLSRFGLPAPRIAPSVENGVGVTLRRGSKSATIEFFNDGDIVAVRSDSVGMPVAWDVATDKKSIEDALNQMRAFVYG